MSNDKPVNTQANNPLHGYTLETILNILVDQLGWGRMGQEVNIRCFTQDPSIKSSLKFLRKTPWAREKVEELFVRLQSASTTDEQSETPVVTKHKYSRL